jgi:superfamily II DNA helicase RecQ
MLDISAQLQSLGLQATYYHGGLSVQRKDKNNTVLDERRGTGYYL